MSLLLYFITATVQSMQLDPAISNPAVEEKRLDDGKWPNLTFVLGHATSLDLASQVVTR